MTRSRTFRSVGVGLLATIAVAAERADAQYAPDTFVDPVARTLFEAAQTNWATLDESILRYTALIQQRIAAAIRTPLKDRIIYRNETAVRSDPAADRRGDSDPPQGPHHLPQRDGGPL